MKSVIEVSSFSEITKGFTKVFENIAASVFFWSFLQITAISSVMFGPFYLYYTNNFSKFVTSELLYRKIGLNEMNIL